MPRRETRSPSPTGSSYSASRRSRRDEDRFPRDRRDPAWSHHGRRSRSRSADRRYRDRDSHRRRDRSVDRRAEDTYRPVRHDRSRERRHSRSPGRDRRNRSRDRDIRDRRDDSRDRTRRRRDNSTDSKRKDDKAVQKPAEPAKPAVAKQTDEDKKKAERLAKLEAWKAKQAQAKAAAELEKQQKEATTPAVTTRTLLQEMDKKDSTPASIASPATIIGDANGHQSPTPFQGTFDSQTMPKKVTGAAKALGSDVPLPVTAKTMPTLPPKVGTQSATSSRAKKAANVSAFGFMNKAGQEAEKKKGLDFGDEVATRKKLEKLPTPPPPDLDNAVAVPEDEDGTDLHDTGTEEEVAAAARAAAEKHEQRVQAAAAGDATMTDAPAIQTPAAESNGASEDDIDPLDAFMATLGKESPKNRKRKLPQAEAIYGDEEERDPVELEADDILAMAASKRKKKDLPTVDHSKIAYEPFRKNFFTESTEMAALSEDEVASLRLELDGIKIDGKNVPKPVLKWAQCGLGVQTLDVIRSLGYYKPTSIQSQAIPAIMSGRDVIGVAKTGSGKTIAFILPMCRHILAQRALDKLDGPISLILAPTRELATQIHKECRPFLKALNLQAVCAYGGAPISDQIASLKKGCHVIVCTPGRMIDLLAANSGRVTNLRRITYLVLDEADRMFDMGFESQVSKIMSNIRPDAQKVLFSATFPRIMESLARKALKDPVQIIVGGRSVVAPEITQIVEVRPENTKFVRLLELLGELYDTDEDARTLIFVDRQEAADGLLNELLHKGYPCGSIHGGKDQYDRDSTIDDFKHGAIPIMIATSVAARGLDVKQLKLVVNYDPPNHLEDYVHRAGRTGRAGNKGTAVTFITEEQERYSIDIIKALKYSGQEIPEALQKMSDSFMEKVKTGKEKAARGGFGGKGLEKLDQDRDAVRSLQRKAFKTGDEPDEDDKENGKKDKDVLLNGPSEVVSSSSASASRVPKEIAIDAEIVVHRTEAPKADGNPLDKVKGVTSFINQRLTQTNRLRPGQPIDNKGPDAGAFHATLEINDYPQKARWAVTNRTNVAKILDATGVSITTKGNFYPANASVPEGSQPKLYILVEGDTEVVVTTAMRELMRLLREGTMAAVESESRAPASGRYSVV
ncbi:P-loop containing nucleoside triphosphate hydrolase protein [Trichodelitschia bisporula]|uniref:RNA helicase n=1 Tax=Trichodelitschia bisporula TaxID=703511 RepID=A0A6G1HZV2_9PEZI|nr:P-loop containing nucleoside triphosphate hydrolase protein [Trichodelitschia bisporula]